MLSLGDSDLERALPALQGHASLRTLEAQGADDCSQQAARVITGRDFALTKLYKRWSASLLGVPPPQGTVVQPGSLAVLAPGSRLWARKDGTAISKPAEPALHSPLRRLLPR
jgi:hypothetical protein